MEAKGITAAEAVGWIVDHWVDSNRPFLDEEFGLNRDRYKRELAEAKVVKAFRIRGSESQSDSRQPGAGMTS